MILTKVMRKNALEALISKVPKIDFKQKIEAEIMALSVRQCNEDIRKVYADKNNHYLLNFSTCRIFGVYCNYLNWCHNWEKCNEYFKSHPVLQELHKLSLAQDLKFESLTISIDSALWSVKTVEKALENWPELKDVLPNPKVKPVANLPAVQIDIKQLLINAGAKL